VGDDEVASSEVAEVGCKEKTKSGENEVTSLEAYRSGYPAPVYRRDRRSPRNVDFKI
jgi:hypothetical protein